TLARSFKLRRFLSHSQTKASSFRCLRLQKVIAASSKIGNMKKPHVIIFSGYGLNTEDETKAVFEQVGATAAISHLNDIIANPAVLESAQIIVFPGGFSYGDDTGSGKAYGNRVTQHL